MSKLYTFDKRTQGILGISINQLTLEGQFGPKRVNAIFKPFISPSSVSLFTMKHFLEVDNEVILLSNGWIWY
jgi:hypothetical protein